MHRFGLEPIDLLGRRDSGIGILVRHRKLTARGEWLRREWRGPGACGERGTGHESEGKPEKMSAFHVPLLAFPTIDREESLSGAG
jgi:hypothetical protein